MIDLTVLELDKLAKSFYKEIKTELKAKIKDEKNYLNGFQTNSGKYFGDYLLKNLELLITGRLEKLIRDVQPELEILFNKEYVNDINKKPSQFKETINSILFYEKHDKWGAYAYTKKLGVKCCPYCNRTYITTLGSDKKKFVRADIDHFLAKSKYPYFRLSFFNLIPSCVICNRNAKGEKKTKLDSNIYPYKEGFNENTKFVYRPKTYLDAIGKGNPKIIFAHYGNSAQTKKANGNIKLFRLKDQYSIHTDELNHLIQLKEVYTTTYIDDLLNTYKGLISTKEEAYKLAFGKEYDLANDYKSPLSKFTRDILDDLLMLNSFKNSQ